MIHNNTDVTEELRDDLERYQEQKQEALEEEDDEAVAYAAGKIMGVMTAIERHDGRSPETETEQSESSEKSGVSNMGKYDYDQKDTETSLVEWINCPHCGSEDVSASDLSPWTDYRPTVECNDCGKWKYFD